MRVILAAWNPTGWPSKTASAAIGLLGLWFLVVAIFVERLAMSVGGS